MKIEDLKRRKEELGYTNELIADKSGVPLGTVQKVFGDDAKKPRYNTLQSIQCVLFPEDHSSKEASLYKDIVQNLSLEWSDGVAEQTALDEYSYETPRDDYAAQYEKVISWKRPGEYTVEDWRNLPDGTLMELIDGVLYDRSWPTKKHQLIISEIYVQIHAAVKEKSDRHCLALMAPTGVQLDKSDDKNGLLPDILIVCDKEKYEGEDDAIIGAPDFVAEVLSPSTEKYDRLTKLNKYWEAGVREYWIIDPQKEVILVYFFERNLLPETYSFEDSIPLCISSGKVNIDFKSISESIHGYFG